MIVIVQKFRCPYGNILILHIHDIDVKNKCASEGRNVRAKAGLDLVRIFGYIMGCVRVCPASPKLRPNISCEVDYDPYFF